MKNLIIVLFCVCFAFPTQAQKVFEHKKIRVGLSLSPFYSYRNLKAPASFQAAVNEFNKIEKAKIAYGASFNLLFAVRKRVILETGVSFTDRGYTQDVDLLFEDPAVESFKRLYIKHHNKYVGIPLKLNLYLVNRKVRLFISGGLHSGMLVATSQRVKATEIDGDIVRNHVKQQIENTHLIISAVAGIGLDFHIVKRLNLRFEPIFRYGIYNSQANEIDYLPYEIGANFGLLLGFK